MTRSTFTQKGFDKRPGFLPSDDLELLRKTCDRLMDEPVSNDNDRHGIGMANRRFLSKRHEEFPDLEAFLLSARIGALVSDYLDTPGYLFNEQFVVKPAESGGSFAWHQDGAYVGFDHRPYLSVWIALDDTTEENGCVHILPRDLAEKPHLDPHRWSKETKDLLGYEGDDPGVPMTAQAGDVVLFSSLTLHRSGANRTGKARRAYLAQFSPEPILVPESGTPKSFAKPVSHPA